MKKNKTTQTPPVRKTGWRWTDPNGCFGILYIVNGDTEGYYLAQRLAPSACLLTKLETGRTTTYAVTFGKAKSCGCEGFKNRSTCKHVEALLKMREEQKL